MGGHFSAKDWNNQMQFFLLKGYRVIAHDRCGYGRPTQTAGGHEMDTYAADQRLADAMSVTYLAIGRSFCCPSSSARRSDGSPDH